MAGLLSGFSLVSSLAVIGLAGDAGASGAAGGFETAGAAASIYAFNFSASIASSSSTVLGIDAKEGGGNFDSSTRVVTNR